MTSKLEFFRRGTKAVDKAEAAIRADLGAIVGALNEAGVSRGKFEMRGHSDTSSLTLVFQYQPSAGRWSIVNPNGLVRDEEVASSMRGVKKEYALLIAGLLEATFEDVYALHSRARSHLDFYAKIGEEAS